MSVITRLFETTANRPRPITTTIELVARCPLHCVHCYVDQGKKERLSLARLTRLFDELALEGGLFLTFTGGEVGLREDLAAIIAAARERRFSVTLLTSGTLWRERQWDELARLGVDSARLSVYGTSAAVHDGITGVSGSHARTMASVRGLLARGIEVGLSCSVLTQNLAEVSGVVALGVEIGASVNIDPVINLTHVGGRAPAAWRVSSEQLRTVLRDPKVRDVLSLDSAGSAHVNANDAPCQVARTSVFIDCDGSVRPCASWPRPGGNINEQTFAHLWRHDPELGRARAVCNRDLSICSGCALHAGCSPCIALNLQEHGVVATPAEVVCARTRAQ